MLNVFNISRCQKNTFALTPGCKQTFLKFCDKIAEIFIHKLALS